jgi:ribonuclease HI
MPTPHISIYTDGSYNPSTNRGGWAAIIFREEEKKILQGQASNTTHQRMELTAAIQALHYLEANNLVSQEIMLYTDSQYLVRLPERKEKFKSSDYLTRKKQPIANVDLVRIIVSFCDVLPVSFIKVKAHLKPSPEENFNREADMLSRQIVRARLPR